MRCFTFATLTLSALWIKLHTLRKKNLYLTSRKIGGLVIFRVDGRRPDESRPVQITPGYQIYAEGSVLIESGNTRLICTVSVENRVPPFLQGTGRGWITAEYAMLPRSTNTRTSRGGGGGGVPGRSAEIQRLIGRSLRAVVDTEVLGNKTFIVDCDVLQADGGTRTLSVTGAYVALYQAFNNLAQRNLLRGIPFTAAVAATSIALVGGEPLLDPCYEEDSSADVDFNVVMTNQGHLVEIQGTAEGQVFTRPNMDAILAVAEKGIQGLFAIQETAIRGM